MHRICITFTLIIICVLCICCKNNADRINKADIALLDSLRLEGNKLTNSPQILPLAQKLKEEASNPNNDLYTAIAYHFMVSYYRTQRPNHDKMAVDSLRMYGQKSIEYYEKASKPEYAIRLDMDILKWEIFSGNTEQTFIKLFNLIRKADNLTDKRIKVDVYSLLGLAYLLSNAPKEALSAFQTELQLLRQLKNANESYMVRAYSGVFIELANAALNNKNYELSISYCDSASFYLNKYPENRNIRDQKIGINAIEFFAHTKMKNLDGAKALYDKILPYYHSFEHREKNQIYYDIKTTLPSYYLETGNYVKALLTVNEIIDYYSLNFQNSLNLYESKDLKSEILTAYGKYEEAFLLKKEIMMYKDSISQINITRQLSEIYTLFQVKELEKEAIKSKTKSRNLLMISVFLIMICMLLITIVIVIRINYNKLRKKNEKIFEQYNKLHKYRRQTGGYNTCFALSKEEKATGKEPSLYEKIEDYITCSECYKQEDISREYLAMQIGTNREYLTRAIQENANMTFTEYINHHRLEYASMLLSENSNISIDSVYLAAGFKNKRTFYRLFKLKYDMTPKEFQNIAINNHQNVF